MTRFEMLEWKAPGGSAGSPPATAEVSSQDTNSGPEARFAQIAVKRSGSERSWPPAVTSYTAVRC